MQEITGEPLERAVEEFIDRNATFRIMFGEESHDSTLTISLFDSELHTIGNITLRKIPDGALAQAFARLPDPVPDLETTFSSLELEELLSTLVSVGATLHSPLGSSAEGIAGEYERKLNTHMRELPRVRIIREWKETEEGQDLARGVRWIDVEDPTHALLTSLGAKVGITNGTISQCFQSGHQPRAQTGSGNLYVLLNEVLCAPGELSEVQVKDLHAVIGPDFIVTIHHGRSPAVERVEGELRRKELSQAEEGSSNYILARILGSSVHATRDISEKLSKRIDAIAANTKDCKPSPQELNVLQKLEHSFSDIRRSLGSLPEVIAALRESEHLYGADKPKDSLLRYQAMARGMLEDVTAVKESAVAARETWHIKALNLMNLYASRLAVAAGATVLPMLSYAYFGQNFTAHIPDWIVHGVGGVSWLASAALLYALWVKKRAS